MSKLLTQLDRAYFKRARSLNKNFIKDNTTGLHLFVEQLKYLRDSLIIKSLDKAEEDPFEETTPDSKITSLVVAISEFEMYQNSEEKDKKVFHWNNFCEFIKLNMQEWLAPNDTI